MSVAPAGRQVARELLKLAKRPQPSSQILQSIRRCEGAKTFSTSPFRPFNFRSAFQQDVKPKPRAQDSNRSSKSPRLSPLPVLAATTGVATVLFALLQPVTTPSETVIQIRPESSESSDPSPSKDSGDDGITRYRLSEIREHGPKSERPWIIYEDKVYDITDWIPAHPGGEVILRAAGSSIEPYWNIFAIHKSQYVRDILEQYVIGKVHSDDLVDGKVKLDSIADPFTTDPDRDERMRFITQKPCNAETPGGELADSFLTPNEVFYKRNHMWVPVVEESEADQHGVSVELPNGDIRVYTIGELKARFKQHVVTSVLQCSGNRRKDMTDHAKKTNGLQWTVGAISCAKWEGVRLRDVLADAGLSLSDPGEDAQHVQFSGLEAYGASIPITSALDPRGDVLLAFRMNDEVLPRDHGFPVRVIVPGHVAARAVKWVNKIVVSEEESTTSWQRKDYKCFGPNEVKQDWDKYKSIQEMPITSAITRCRLRPLSTTIGSSDAEPSQPKYEPESKMGSPGQQVEVEGYAYSGGGREIQRVDISLDGGKTWDQARLLDDKNSEHGSKSWCWKRWTYLGVLPDVAVDPVSTSKKGIAAVATEGPAKTTTTFVVKATDEAYNTQPETHKSIYNLRGNLATAWHRVEFDCGGKPCADRVKEGIQKAEMQKV